jgi:hypothetical protein
MGASSAGTGATPVGSSPQGSSGQGSSGATARASGAGGAPDDKGPAGAGAGSSEPSSPNQPTNPSPSTPGAAECDLTGRWLNTLHYTTDGLGNLQYIHKFIYYEIERKGDAFTVKKGLQCGNDTIGGGTFAITADFSGAWPALMRRMNYAGRAATSAKVANGCKVELAKLYTVIGATLPYYLDPATPLPSAADKAAGSTPGWEDWDGDGNPGVTGVISGTVTGKVFVAAREWTSMSGTVPSVGSVFTLPLQWDQEPNVMAYDGSAFLGAEAIRAADASLHYAQFARLSADQATGDDAAICKSIVKLAPTLTPKAAGN